MNESNKVDNVHELHPAQRPPATWLADDVGLLAAPNEMYTAGNVALLPLKPGGVRRLRISLGSEAA